MKRILYAWTAFSCSLVYSTVTYIIMTMLVGWRGWSLLCLHPSTLCIEMRPGTSTSMSILSITSKMSRMQLPLEKSFRVSLCDQPKKNLDGTPKCPGKVYLKFPNQCRQFSYTYSTVWETSNTLFQGILGSHQIIFWEISHRDLL